MRPAANLLDDQGGVFHAQVMLSRVAALAFCLLLAPASAQVSAPARDNARPSSNAPAAAPQPALPAIVREPMTFRLVEGVGARAATRWIAASGRIVRNTPRDFKAFVADNKVAGLTVYFDSHGGLVASSLVLGREIRAAGLNTSVGRTIALGGAGEKPRHALVSHAAACSSACVYAMMGGVERVVEPSVRLGVHQFSGRLNSDDSPMDPAYGVDDFRYAQRQMASIAAYMQEMGTDLRLLQTITSVPYGQSLAILRRPEIVAVKLADVVPVPRDTPVSFGWTMFQRVDDPSLHRRAVRMSGTARTDDDLTLLCARDGRMVLQWRQTQIEPKSTGPGPTWTGARISAGPEKQVLKVASGASGTQAGPTPSLWIATALEAPLIKATTETGTFDIELAASAGGGYDRRIALGGGDFATTMKGFVAACAAIPRVKRADAPSAPASTPDEN